MTKTKYPYFWIAETAEQDCTNGMSRTMQGAKIAARKAVKKLFGVSEGWTCEIYNRTDILGDPNARPLYAEAHRRETV